MGRVQQHLAAPSYVDCVCPVLGGGPGPAGPGPGVGADHGAPVVTGQGEPPTPRPAVAGQEQMIEKNISTQKNKTFFPTQIGQLSH